MPMSFPLQQAMQDLPSNTDRRMFLGIPIPLDIGSHITHFRRQFTPSSQIRWVPDAQLHITVYFLGNVPEERIPNLIELFHEILRKHASFELILDRFVYAPRLKNPRMIWLRLQKSAAFRELVQDIHSLYMQIEQQQQRKSPIPHITLARLRNFSPEDWVNMDMKVPRVSMPIQTLILWESQLSPSGATYIPVQQYELN